MSALNKLLYKNKTCHYSFKVVEKYTFDECEALVSDLEILFLLNQTGIYFSKSMIIDVIKNDSTFAEYLKKYENKQKEIYFNKNQSESGFIKNCFESDRVLEWFLNSFSMGLINETWPRSYYDEDKVSKFYQQIEEKMLKNKIQYDPHLLNEKKMLF